MDIYREMVQVVLEELRTAQVREAALLEQLEAMRDELRRYVRLQMG